MKLLSSITDVLLHFAFVVFTFVAFVYYCFCYPIDPGTQTTLLTPRDADHSDAGFQEWPLMSVHTWGEDPVGDWRVDIFDTVSRHGVDILDMVLDME